MSYRSDLERTTHDIHGGWGTASPNIGSTGEENGGLWTVDSVNSGRALMLRSKVPGWYQLCQEA